jgi:hypothetical protein
LGVGWYLRDRLEISCLSLQIPFQWVYIISAMQYLKILQHQKTPPKPPGYTSNCNLNTTKKEKGHNH